MIAVFLVSVSLGKYSVSLPELVSILFRKIIGLEQTWADTTDVALFNIRIPRIFVAAIVGASLSVAGAVYQGLFRNPMASPDILGASAGAGFGAAVAIMVGLNTFAINGSSFLFGISAVLLCYSIARLVSHSNNMTFTLILTGLVTSSMFTSFTSILKFVADPNDKLPAITFWLMGGLNSVILSRVTVFLIPVIIAIIPIFLLRWQLNIIAFGDEEAKSLGTDVKRIRGVMIICATLLTAATVAIAGLIGWVGLIIPHVARLIVGPNYKGLIPASAIIGAIFLMIVDDIARCAVSVEIPLGILTGIIGGPFFIYLLFKGRRNNAA